MKAAAQTLALLLLAATPVVTAPTAVWAQPFGREQQAARQERRAERQERRAERREEPRIAAPPYAGPVYPAPYRGQPYRGPQPYDAAPPRAYGAPPAYLEQGYAYAPPPAYRPNSLGPGWGLQQEEARRGVLQGRLLTLRDAAASVRRTTPGHMLDAGLEPGPGGRPAYRVRWAAQGGRRIDFIVDAATGQIIGRSGY